MGSIRVARMCLSINSLEMRALKVKQIVKMALFGKKMTIFDELKLITQIFWGGMLVGISCPILGKYPCRSDALIYQ